MTSKGTEIRYKCFNDCLQSGCPGHRVVASYSHSSDMIAIQVDEDHRVFDENEWAAMQEAYTRINWGDGAPPTSPFVAAETERCAKIAEERAAQYDVEERGCWNDGESAANALREIAAKIRGGQ